MDEHLPMLQLLWTRQPLPVPVAAAVSAEGGHVANMGKAHSGPRKDKNRKSLQGGVIGQGPLKGSYPSVGSS